MLNVGYLLEIKMAKNSASTVRIERETLAVPIDCSLFRTDNYATGILQYIKPYYTSH